jgi:hypothetical protein
MVLKVSVTDDIDKFYKHVKKCYDFTMCRGYLVFYDDDDVANFELIYALNGYLCGEKTDPEDIFVKKENAHYGAPKKYKYTVEFPKKIICGKYNLRFTKNKSLHQMHIFMLPNIMRNMHTLFQNQDLSIVNDDDFTKIINDYNNNNYVSILLSDDDTIINYLEHLALYVLNNVDYDTAIKYLSCIGYIKCQTCNKHIKNDDIIFAISRNNFTCINHANDKDYINKPLDKIDISDINIDNLMMCAHNCLEFDGDICKIVIESGINYINKHKGFKLIPIITNHNHEHEHEHIRGHKHKYRHNHLFFQFDEIEINYDHKR